jgi:hypothetical protein
MGLLFDVQLADVAGLHVEAPGVADLDPADRGAARRIGHFGEPQHAGQERDALLEVAHQEM